MIRRPPRSTQSRSSAASDVYKRQLIDEELEPRAALPIHREDVLQTVRARAPVTEHDVHQIADRYSLTPVSYTHLRAHETDSYLVCRLLLEKKQYKTQRTT